MTERQGALLLLATISALALTLGLITGRIGGLISFDRDDSPCMYWFIVVAFVFMICLGLIGAVTRPWP